MITIKTFTPVRSPINTQSEIRASFCEQKNKEFKALIDSLLCEEFPNTLNDTTQNGYITTQSDNLPNFFMPLYVGKVDLTSIDLEYANTQHWFSVATVRNANIHVYDDTLSIIQLEIELPLSDLILSKIKDKSIEKDLNILNEKIYKKIIHPRFVTISSNINGIKKKFSVHNALIKPDNFTIFNDIFFNSEVSFDPLWTGRVLFLPNDVAERKRQELSNWLEYSLEDIPTSYKVAPGNIVVFNENEVVKDDWSKVLLSLQIYNSYLSVFNDILKEQYSILNDDKVMKNKSLGKLLNKTKKIVEHINFINLEFNELIVGTQNQRIIYLESVRKSWKLELLTQNTLHRSLLIKDRVSAINEENSYAIRKTVELLLAGIGCLSIIDIFVTLISTSKNLKQDNIIGVFDLFRMVPQDVMSWISIIFVSAILLYLRRTRS